MYMLTMSLWRLYLMHVWRSWCVCIFFMRGWSSTFYLISISLQDMKGAFRYKCACMCYCSVLFQKLKNNSEIIKNEIIYWNTVDFLCTFLCSYFLLSRLFQSCQMSSMFDMHYSYVQSTFSHVVYLQHCHLNLHHLNYCFNAFHHHLRCVKILIYTCVDPTHGLIIKFITLGAMTFFLLLSVWPYTFGS